MDDNPTDPHDVAQETPADQVFRPPSIHVSKILDGESYFHFSPVPAVARAEPSTECVLGIDEAGRGPVLGPMVYALFYLPLSKERTLLRDTHHYDDSKALTPARRSSLMETLCTAGSDLHESCGWATACLSAKSISSNMLRPVSAGTYNLNAQAMDATVELIRGIVERGVHVGHVYVDTIGQPAAYQKRLERLFPNLRFTVAKKADSLYPCVSAASVCAKVTRDAALDVCFEARSQPQPGTATRPTVPVDSWGSGYPSDPRCTTWLKSTMDPVFGWGNECRFSWATARELLEVDGPLKMEWVEEDGDNSRMTDYYGVGGVDAKEQRDELAQWFGQRVDESVF